MLRRKAKQRLIYGPLIYRKVDRPIIFVDAFLAAGYVKSRVISG